MKFLCSLIMIFLACGIWSSLSFTVLLESSPQLLSKSLLFWPTDDTGGISYLAIAKSSCLPQSTLLLLVTVHLH